MQDINTRGTFIVTKACVPHLREAANPHILTLSPPIGLKPQWLGPHIAYTIAKYGMSLCALGWAEEFREAGIASNALWPRTLVATAAVQNLLGGDAAMARARARGLRRRRLRDSHPPQPRVHRQHLPLRGRARGGGRHRSRRHTPTSRARSCRSTCSSTTSDDKLTLVASSNTRPGRPVRSSTCAAGCHWRQRSPR